MKKSLKEILMDVSGIVAAFASGILTEQIVGFLSTSEIVVKSSKTKEELFEIQEVDENFLGVFFGTIICYVFLFWLLNNFFPFVICKLEQVRYKRKKRVRKSEFIEVYALAKQKILQYLFQSSETESLDNRIDYRLMLFEQIAFEINILYKYFCVSSKKNKNALKCAFRIQTKDEKKMLSDIGRYISKYDFISLLQSVDSFCESLLANKELHISGNLKLNAEFESDVIGIQSLVEEIRKQILSEQVC